MFRTAEGVFTVELQNRKEMNESISNHETGPKGIRSIFRTQEDKAAIHILAKNRGEIKRKEVEDVCGVVSIKVLKILKGLCEDGLLVQEKRGNQTVYSPV